MALILLATIQAADIGKEIKFSQIAGSVNFSGATVNLLVTNPAGVTTSYACTIDGSNTYPLYVTTGSEFPIAGNYTLQLDYHQGDEIIHSPTGVVKVLANLAA